MAYNDYLEYVENLVFDLVEGKGKVRLAAERKLEEYRLGNIGEIEENRRVGLQEVEMERMKESNQKEAARQRRLALLKQEQEDKAGVVQAVRDTIDQLANDDGHAEEITRRAEKIILKKSGARRRILEAAPIEDNGSAREGLTIRGLKKKEAPTVEKPYDPFGGIHLTPTKYVLQDNYENQWLQGVKNNDQQHLTGGWSLAEYYSRTMFEAFSGLSVFIEDEKNADIHQTPSADVATQAAAQVSGGKMNVDDVF